MANANELFETQARRYRRRLASLRNVRTGLADTIRALEGGERDAATAAVIVDAYATLARVLESMEAQGKASELEARLSRLEAALRPRGVAA